ncbi:MAG: polyprenyl diphosphate synthase [Dehalococcoidia bacterium]|nr:polyprenyl diphosphate synthase [Dehalococcoidia bacterium]
MTTVPNKSVSFVGQRANPPQQDHSQAVALSRAGPISLPKHVAIIMDGNGRWARMRGKPRLAGHRAGTANLRLVIEGFAKYGIKYLTLYAFSTENWTRPRAEVRGLFRILSEVIDREARFLHEKGVMLRHLGTLEGLSPAMQDRVCRALNLTKDNTGMVVSIAFNYGGRAEILEAVRKIIAEGLRPQEVDEAAFSARLYTSGLPDPDLVIRTGGEVRLSNFLLWQTAYSEYYATPTFWPDFGKDDVEKALLAYSQRQRRYGGLNEQPHSAATE